MSAAVFLRDDSGWWLECFQGDKPSDDAEAEFQYMLDAGVPDAILDNGESFILTTADEITSVFPKVAKLLEGFTVIASPVRHENTVGVRIAWRDQTEPFSDADLTAIQCKGNCPDGCI